MILDFEFKCKINHNFYHVHQLNNQNEINIPKIKWNEKKKDEFIDIINSNENELFIQNIYSKLDNVSNESCINECIDDLCTLFKNAGNAHANYVNKNNDNFKNSGLWYDSDCREKKKVFDMYEKQFRLSGSDEDKTNMCKEEISIGNAVVTKEEYIKKTELKNYMN